MSEITKALYSNHINIIRNEAEEIQEYDVINEQDIKELVEYLKTYKPDVNEAEYQGRKVKLGKPMRGDTKKFKVYVKNPKGNVCLLYTSPSPRDLSTSRMPSSA